MIFELSGLSLLDRPWVPSQLMRLSANRSRLFEAALRSGDVDTRAFRIPRVLHQTWKTDRVRRPRARSRPNSRLNSPTKNLFNFYFSRKIPSYSSKIGVKWLLCGP